MNKRLILIPALLAGFAGSIWGQDYYDDDIYYNPKKDTVAKKKTTKKISDNYIADFSNIDVDTYNMAGNFMPMPADTIGAKSGSGEDFVYTQQIQKYYNPTIVIDNADLLADVLNNSYGNVDIVINDNGLVSFAPYSCNWPYWSYSYGWPYSYGWGAYPYYCGGLGWNIGFGYYDPFYAWGPSWGWGWGPGYYPGWGAGWTWGPVWSGNGYHYADRTPNGNRRSGATSGWSQNARPGGNYAGNHRVSGGRYTAPGYTQSATSTSGNHRIYNRGESNSSTNATGTYRGNPSNNRGYTINSSGHRVSGNGSTNMNSSTTNRRNYNNNTNNNSRTYNSNRSYNSGTYRGGAGSSGSMRGAGGGGGGARGRHR